MPSAWTGRYESAGNAALKGAIAALVRPSRPAFARAVREIVDAFGSLPLRDLPRKPRIGVVGEILVKYNPEANGRIVELIEAEGGEAVVPDLYDFLLYSCYNGLFRRSALEGSLGEALLARASVAFLEWFRARDAKANDLPLADMPVAAPDILYQVQLRGITPILAHPERNRYLVEHPAALKDLVERGIEVQVNSGSLAGIFGKQARNSARLLLKEGAARLVASDAHGTKGRNPDLSGAAKALTRLLGKEAPRLLLEINPGRALDGENITND